MIADILLIAVTIDLCCGLLLLAAARYYGVEQFNGPMKPKLLQFVVSTSAFVIFGPTVFVIEACKVIGKKK